MYTAYTKYLTVVFHSFTRNILLFRFQISMLQRKIDRFESGEATPIKAQMDFATQKEQLHL